MAFDPTELIEPQKQAPSGGFGIALAMILALLEEMAASRRDGLPGTDPREQNAREIHVRPRVEPLGGA
jgi:hypothetical protein